MHFSSFQYKYATDFLKCLSAPTASIVSSFQFSLGEKEEVLLCNALR